MAILGVPFDSGVSYRPGAQFGPAAIRAGSKLLRPYHAPLEVEPWYVAPGRGCRRSRPEPVRHRRGHRADRGRSEGDARTRAIDCSRSAATTPSPCRSCGSRSAPADRSPSCTSMPTSIPGTPISAPRTRTGRRSGARSKRACSRATDRSTSGSAARCTGRPTSPMTPASGSRSSRPPTSPGRASNPRSSASAAGWGTRPCTSASTSTSSTRPTRPGTGTPEPGGLSSREAMLILRGLAGLPIAGVDIVEVAPPYDHAELTALAAANLAYECLALFALSPGAGAKPGTGSIPASGPPRGSAASGRAAGDRRSRRAGRPRRSGPRPS